jgi:hypothetical protein
MKSRWLEVTVAVAVLIGLAWMIMPVHSDSHREREVSRAWFSQIADVKEGKTSAIALPDMNLQSSCLDRLSDVADKVTELNLSGDQLANKLEQITRCTRLKVLHLRTELGDRELQAIAQMPNLEVLDLPLALSVTDAGLEAIAEHPKLLLVRLRAPQVTDSGLKAFARMPKLRWLHLMEVPLTDAGLLVFQEMPRLESLYLDGDRATDEGLSSLVLARRDLHFHRDQVHIPSDPRNKDGHTD